MRQREAHVTVAAVDIGILNLTKYQLPNPTEHYFGQRQLSGELRDLYGFSSTACRHEGRLPLRRRRDGHHQRRRDKPTQEPFARYSGVVKVGPDGTARVSFDVPAFNGSARGMAVAWTKSQVGQASSDVFIVIRSSPRRRCRASSRSATARASMSRSTMSRATPATTISTST